MGDLFSALGSPVSSIQLLAGGFICFLVRGWISHVDQNLALLWQKHDAEIEARGARWKELTEKCAEELAELNRIKGVLQGREILKF